MEYNFYLIHHIEMLGVYHFIHTKRVILDIVRIIIFFVIEIMKARYVKSN